MYPSLSFLSSFDVFSFSFPLSHTRKQWELHAEFGGIIYFGLTTDVCVSETSEGWRTKLTFVDITSKVG